MTRRPDAPARGFTLIEVVVALAIVALGMMALFRTVSDAANNAAYLRDRSLAAWIATDRVAEIRLSGEFPSVDETEGETEMARQRWRWKASVSETPVKGLRRVDVRVRLDGDPEDTSLAQATGFIGQAMQQAGATGAGGGAWQGPPAPNQGAEAQDEGPARPPPPKRTRSPGTNDQEGPEE